MSLSTTSGSLVLAEATPQERFDIWTREQPSWGPLYTLPAYINREAGLLSTQLTRQGGLTAWILTDSSTASPGHRPILSSVEVFRKRAAVRDADGRVRRVTALGVASVFTFEEFRRQGYASRMLSLLGDKMAEWQARDPGSAEFSVLFSDIGKVFYADLQWMPFPSEHLSFASSPPLDALQCLHQGRITLVTGDNLHTVAELDEATLLRKLARPSGRGHKVRAAILPDYATYEWQLAREKDLCTHLLDKAPTVHGAIYTPEGLPASRVWMLWANSLHGGEEKPEENVMNILHYALEDDDIPDDHLSKALAAIVGVVQSQAQQWLCPKIDMWNPDERTQKLLSQVPGLQTQLVVRQTSSIASLRWFGQGPVSDLEWVDNQKFEWC
jgi:hypothetical protein